MLRQKGFLICLSILMTCSFSMCTFASSQVKIEIKQGSDNLYVTSEYFSVKKEDILTWSVLNTSTEHDLSFQLNPLPFPMCGTTSPVVSKAVKPNEKIQGIELGENIADLASGFYQIGLLNASGVAQLDVYSITNATTLHVNQSTGPQYAGSSFLEVPSNGILAWNITNTSKEADLTYSVSPKPQGWCGTTPSLKHGIVKPGESIKGFIHTPTADFYRLTIIGQRGDAQLYIAN